MSRLLSTLVKYWVLRVAVTVSISMGTIVSSANVEMTPPGTRNRKVFTVSPIKSIKHFTMSFIFF